MMQLHLKNVNTQLCTARNNRCRWALPQPIRSPSAFLLSCTWSGRAMPASPIVNQIYSFGNHCGLGILQHCLSRSTGEMGKETRAFRIFARIDPSPWVPSDWPCGREAGRVRWCLQLQELLGRWKPRRRRSYPAEPHTRSQAR